MVGLFSFFSTKSQYSQIEHPFTELELERMITHEHLNTLDQTQVELVRRAILGRRGGDGKISLRQIYEVLLQLKNQNKISKYDYAGLMKLFEKYFSQFSN